MTKIFEVPGSHLEKITRDEMLQKNIEQISGEVLPALIDQAKEDYGKVSFDEFLELMNRLMKTNLAFTITKELQFRNVSDTETIDTDLETKEQLLEKVNNNLTNLEFWSKNK